MEEHEAATASGSLDDLVAILEVLDDLSPDNALTLCGTSSKP